MQFEYDLIVIGAGPAGVAAARLAAKCGARVAIVERNRIGGDCVNSGCIPEKFMSFAAGFSKDFAAAIGYGWSPTQGKGDWNLDWQRFTAEKQEQIRHLNRIHLCHLEDAGVELVRGYATLLDAHRIGVVDLAADPDLTQGTDPGIASAMAKSGSQRTLSAEKILLAVGASDAYPKIPGTAYALTWSQIFGLQQQPQHLAIVGCSYIDLKLAGNMNGMGSKVTLIFDSDRVLPQFDADLSWAIQTGLAQQGVEIYPNTQTKGIVPCGGGIQLSLARHELAPEAENEANENTAPSEITVDTVVCACPRTPDLSRLELEKANVQLTESGAVWIDEYYRTTQPNIFAIGDCTERSPFQLTPVATAEARSLINREFGQHWQPVRYDNIPIAVSFYPEAATVGWSEEQAREQLGDQVKCYCKSFCPLFHSMTHDSEKTFMKLVVERSSDRVLGIHMVGEGAIEIIQMATVALNLGVTKHDFDRTIGIHPSSTEEFFTLD